MWIEKSCRVCLQCRVVKGFLYSRVKNRNEIMGRVPKTVQDPTSLHELHRGLHWYQVEMRIVRATRRILNGPGSCIIPVDRVLDGNIEFGIRPDNDGPEIRATLRTPQLDQRVRHMDEPGTPAEYTAQRVDHDAVAVRAIPEQGANELRGIA
jgi:hypothetical protein